MKTKKYNTKCNVTNVKKDEKMNILKKVVPYVLSKSLITGTASCAKKVPEMAQDTLLNELVNYKKIFTKLDSFFDLITKQQEKTQQVAHKTKY